MKKNIGMAVMAIVLILQYLGLIPGLSNQDIADTIVRSVSGREPVHLEQVED